MENETLAKLRLSLDYCYKLAIIIVLITRRK